MYTVVLADDEHLICDSMARILSSVPGIEIIGQFYNGHEAYDFLSAHSVDLCLLDISMPGKSGLDIAELLQRQNHGTQVILISAHRDFDFARRAIDCGVSTYLTKPFSSAQLISAVSHAMAALENQADQTNYRWLTTRNLIVFLATSGALPENIPDMQLCNECFPIDSLRCTEVLISVPNMQIMSAALQDTVFNMLRSFTEQDGPQQSCCCFRRNADEIVLLVFSKGKPDLRFMEEAIPLIAGYSTAPIEHTYASFPSFSSYLVQSMFARRMNEFFHILSSHGSKQAKLIIEAFLQTATPEVIGAFARYLTDWYQIPIDSADSKGILNAVDILLDMSGDNSSSHHLVDAVKERIDQHFGSPSLSLESIAESLFVSSEHLSRTFRKITGQRFSDYLVSFRMERAKQLLLDTGMPTVRVAEAVGYTNSAYFRSCFKAHFGITPSQYRQIQARERGEVL